LNLNIADREVYIPTANDNSKSDKPITFHLRFLTSEEQVEMEYMEFSQVGRKDSNRFRVKVDNKYIFSRGVESIDNLSVSDKPITTAEQFLAIRGPKWLAEMIAEVGIHLKNAMEIDEKN